MAYYDSTPQRSIYAPSYVFDTQQTPQTPYVHDHMQYTQAPYSSPYVARTPPPSARRHDSYIGTPNETPSLNTKLSEIPNSTSPHSIRPIPKSSASSAAPPSASIYSMYSVTPATPSKQTQEQGLEPTSHISLRTPQPAPVAPPVRQPAGLPTLHGSPPDTEDTSSIADQWVTVFGFPPSYTSIVLSTFHNYGQIVRVKHASNQGNWVHILYQTKLQAQKALGKNGTIIHGNIMIGVMPCTERDVVLSEKVEGLAEQEDTSVFPKPNDQGIYKPASPEYGVDVSNDNDRPRPKKGFFSSLLEHVIGAS